MALSGRVFELLSGDDETLFELGLHAFDGLHLSGNFNEGLVVIESLEDSGSERLLDVVDGSGSDAGETRFGRG